MGKCYNHIEINSDINNVWQTVSDFYDMSWAENIITSLEKVGDKKFNEKGAKRILNNAFHETLIEFEPESYRFTYSIDDGPGPVASDAVENYIGVVQLTGCSKSCVVEWSSSYESSDDGEVAAFCNPIYQGLLKALKDKFNQ